MRTQLTNRLQQLKVEYESGAKMLADLEQKQAQLRETMLRISGAIQVLEELLAAQPQTTPAEEAHESRSRAA
jgi:predicted nuclease with TOPRIM domain